MLKTEWLNENGNATCDVCGRKFSVPEGETISQNICEECAAQTATAAAEVDLKANAEADKILSSAVK